MNCRKCQAEIETRGRRRLLGAEARAHVEGCAACFAFAAEQQALQALLADLEPVAAPADFDFRLRARMAADEEAGRGRRSWLGYTSNPALVTLAGCFALALAATLYLQQTRSQFVNRTPKNDGVVGSTIIPAVSPPRLAPEIAATGALVRTDSRTTILPAVGSLVQQPEVRGRQSFRRNSLTRQRERFFTEEMAGSKSVPAGVDSLALRSATPVMRGIPVEAVSSRRPMHIELRDLQGGSRFLTVEPISFGSRDGLNQRGQVNQISISSHQGVW